MSDNFYYAPHCHINQPPNFVAEPFAILAECLVDVADPSAPALQVAALIEPLEGVTQGRGVNKRQCTYFARYTELLSIVDFRFICAYSFR
jgi:hypothetical protein